jgi:hypothetical protein
VNGAPSYSQVFMFSGAAARRQGRSIAFGRNV